MAHMGVAAIRTGLLSVELNFGRGMDGAFIHQASHRTAKKHVLHEFSTNNDEQRTANGHTGNTSLLITLCNIIS